MVDKRALVIPVILAVFWVVMAAATVRDWITLPASIDSVHRAAAASARMHTPRSDRLEVRDLHRS